MLGSLAERGASFTRRCGAAFSGFKVWSLRSHTRLQFTQNPEFAPKRWFLGSTLLPWSFISSLFASIFSIGNNDFKNPSAAYSTPLADLAL